MKKIDNYEVWVTDWQQRFLSMDHDALVRKLPFLEKDQDRLGFRYFGEPYTICCSDGIISPAGTSMPLVRNDILNIYTLFWYSNPRAVLQQNWIPFYQLKSASPFAAAFDRGILKPLAETFGGKEHLLRQALSRMGGIALSDRHTDHLVCAFDCIPIRVLFWDGDEDFPPQANLLFDESATDFNHVESIVTIASALLRRLSLYSHTDLDQSTF